MPQCSTDADEEEAQRKGAVQPIVGLGLYGVGGQQLRLVVVGGMVKWRCNLQVRPLQ